MIRLRPFFCRISLLTILCLCAVSALAQSNLDRRISINVNKVKLSDLLNEVGKQGGFYFSYSSDLISTDSLISIGVSDKPVSALLDQLFKDEVAYKEAAGYVILRPAPNRMKLVPDAADEPENAFNISGYVLDDKTGAAVPFASIYEKRLLISTLSDENGFFKLKFKATGSVTLTVSKKMYKDTIVNFLSKVVIPSKPRVYTYTADSGSTNAEKSWLGRFFMSSKLKRQAKNVGEFVTGVPVQTSIIPGLGNHGLMSGQIVNNFSLNMLGGYNAGVNGVELGGLYNLNKQNVKYVQAAGLSNVVGGGFSGVELAGINNMVYNDVNGVQAAGVVNMARQNASGVQLAGITNMVYKDFKGVQAAGIVNLDKENATGLQLAGIANINRKTANGLQVSGIFNKARVLNGVHLSLINIADTLNGCAINLVSFSKNGYHQLAIYTDENLITTLAYKSGNANLYTKVIGGYHFTGDDKYFTTGIALGHDFKVNKKWLLSTELTSQLLYAKSWNKEHQLNKVSALLTIPVADKLAVFFGPSWNLFDLGQNNTASENTALTKNKIAFRGIGADFKSWVGWTVGITLF